MSTSDDANRKDDERLLIKAALIGCAVILGLMIAAWWFISCRYGSPNNAGAFGDMFGAVNALFSGLAFLGVVIAILLQRNELSLQRQELRDTREELKGQKEQLALQNETFQRQAFENAFFQMLALHHKIVDGIDHTVGGERVTGRDSIQHFFKTFSQALANAPFVGLPEGREKYEKAFTKMYFSFQNDIGHYFRHLYTMIKFVDESQVENKRFYTNIVRAQLSAFELLLLFYNCSVSDLGKGLKPLVENYSMLKNMPFESLFHTTHKAWFDGRAYAKSSEIVK